MFRRFMLILKAKFSKALDRAEDPNETLDYAYEQQMQLLQNVRAGVADVATAKKQLELQAQRLQDQLVKLEGQARSALAGGREDLARRALELKAGTQQQLRDLDPQVAALQQRQDSLTAQQQQLAEALARFRSEKEVQKARYNAAQAMVAIGEAATGLSKDMADATMAVQRANDKTEQMEARASALDELVSSGALQDMTAGGKSPLDRELEQLSANQSVDNELASLKAELGPPAPPPALEASDPLEAAPPVPAPEHEETA
jgi:phage shock protein A